VVEIFGLRIIGGAVRGSDCREQNRGGRKKMLKAKF
jgi:hypothetical protein